MTRDDENEVWLSFDDTNIDGRLLGTQHADMDWQAGVEARFGRILNNCGLALEAVYWGIYADTQEANAFPGPGNLNSSFDFGELDYDNGGGAADVNNFFDAAQRHRLQRRNEFHNIELNLIRHPIYGNVLRGGYDSPWYAGWTLGIRFFKFDEDLPVCYGSKQHGVWRHSC